MANTEADLAIARIIRAGDHLFRHLDGEMISSRDEAKKEWDAAVADYGWIKTKRG